MSWISIGIRLRNAQLKSGLEEARNSVRQFKGQIAGVFAGLGAGAGITQMTREFVDFDKRMAEVFTLLPGISQGAMDRMKDQVRDFSEKFGVLPGEVLPALYQALSAGVPPENVFSFMETAQKAAKGGVADLQTAVDGITSVVNAYGGETLSAAEASDLMFTAVKLGKTNFDQLSRSLFNVVPQASALNLSFGQVTAALAAMTAQGVPTSVATTQLRQLLVELSKEGSKTSETFKEVAGVGFADFVAQGGSLEDALRMIQSAADGSGKKVQDLFGSVEASNAALSLLKGNAFHEALDAMIGSAGATEEAFDTMEQTVSAKIDRLKAKLSSFSIEVAQAFFDAFEGDSEGIQILLFKLLGVAGRFGGKIIDFLAQAGQFAYAALKTPFVYAAEVLSAGLAAVIQDVKVSFLETLNSWIEKINNLPGIEMDLINLDEAKSKLDGLNERAGRAGQTGIGDILTREVAKTQATDFSGEFGKFWEDRTAVLEEIRDGRRQASIDAAQSEPTRIEASPADQNEEDGDDPARSEKSKPEANPEMVERAEPSLPVDSLQAIGGGGNVGSVPDPILRESQRQTGLLERIATAVESKEPQSESIARLGP